MPEPVKFKTVDEAVQAYVDVRNELRLHMKAAKIKEDELKDFLEKVSMWLRDKGDEIGVDSFKTKHGTAYRNEKKVFRIGSWEDFVAWIKDTGNFQCLEKRVAKNATKEICDEAKAYNKEHANDPGFKPKNEIPDGIELFVEVEFNVLSPKKKPGEDD